MPLPSLRTAAMLLLCLLAVDGARAAMDKKAVTPTMCQPVGPGTTIGELTFNSFGVYNPGATSESVLCALPSDGDYAYSSNPGTSAAIQIYFRAGAEAGKVACTVYSGSTVNSPMATYTSSYSPAPLAAGGRDNYGLYLADVSGYYGVAVPANVLCTLSPKAALGTIYLFETVFTNVP